MITRSARLVQKGDQKIRLENVMSAAVEFPDMDYEIVADGGICFNSNRQCLLPHFGQKEGYSVYCQKEYEL